MKRASWYKLILALAAGAGVIAALFLVIPQRGLAELARTDEEAPAAPNTAGEVHWSPPLNLSGWQFFGEGAELEMGPDGTQAAFWDSYNPDSQQIELWGNVYSPGVGWSGAEKLDPRLQWASMDIAPDGTVWVARGITDTVQGKARVVMSWRHPGASWQSEPISDWETVLRGVDLHIGPDGDMVAAWVACDKTDPSNLADGNCAVRVRRRPVGALDWEPATRVDNSGAGVWEIHTRVGPSGMTMVIWTEAAALNPDSWAVTARTCAGGAWSPGPANVSGWIEPRKSSNWLAEPVMGIDGTVVVAWYAKTSPGSAQDGQYSATREPGGTWSAPVQISAAHDASTCWKPTLALGQGGTAVAAWMCTTSGTRQALFANARDAGSAWGAEVQVSDPMSSVIPLDLGVWPGGTAMGLWQVQDTSRPAATDYALFWSARPPSGDWGDGGEGRLGEWVDHMTGGALELGGDGSAFALWSIRDADLPTGEQGSIQAAYWPPGGSWEPPSMLAGGYASAHIYPVGLQIGPGGQPVAAAWRAARNVTDQATPSNAIFYSRWPEYRAYLPLVLRSSP